MTENSSLRVRLRAIRWEAERINTFILEPLEGGSLPPFTAGAHVTVDLPDGLSRSYSLLNDPAERDRYEIAVHHAPESRGGSRHVHEHWRAGDVLTISPPRNNFPLAEGAAESVLIAGGIGITPLLSMVVRLSSLGRRWALHYGARTRVRAAFLDRLEGQPQVHLAFDEEADGAPLDLPRIVAEAGPDAHLYCCGPAGMLARFEELAAGRPCDQVHLEYFSATEATATEGGYVLDLRRTGKRVAVAPGQRMLDALLAAGTNVSFACSEGVCGTCETVVLAGEPDHRDDFLTGEERAAGNRVMPCCSGSKSPVLVLDL